MAPTNTPSLYPFQEKAIKELAGDKHIAVMPVGCLAKGTPIKMADGTTKPVEQVKAGDVVLSYDEENNQIVDNVVDFMIRTSHRPKPMLQLEYAGETITTTYDHYFWGGDGFYPLYQLIWGALEASERAQLKLLCEQYGQALDDQTVWCKHSSSNEAEPRQQRLSENYDGQPYCESAPYCGGELAGQPEQFTSSEPLERGEGRQQGGELGVGERKIQCVVWDYTRLNKANDKPQQNTMGREKAESSTDVQRVDGDQKAQQKRSVGHNEQGLPRNEKDVRQHSLSSSVKVIVKEAEPYYTIGMREAPYAYCIGQEHCFITHNSGKTAVMMNWLKNTGKKHVLIVTTASKRDSGDMLREADVWCGSDWRQSLSSFSVIGWAGVAKFVKNLRDFSELSEYAVAFDEVQSAKHGVQSQRGKAFLTIVRYTDAWTGYTATPGDKWIDYQAYAVATKFVANLTAFKRKYCVIQTFKGFPEIVGYNDTYSLKRWWNKASSRPDTHEMYEQMPKEVGHTVEFKAPAEYKRVLKTRETLEGEFLDTTMGLCHYLRQACANDKARRQWLEDYMTGNPEQTVFFTNYKEEAEMVSEIHQKIWKGAKVWRIDGQHHEIPTAETIGEHDIVVANYQSGAEGLNLQFMHYCVFVSPNYSYSTSRQAKGRINRLGQTRTMYYYYLRATGTIEDNIYKALKDKGDFSEKTWSAQLEEE